LINQPPFFESFNNVLDFTLSEDKSYFKTTLPDILDANDDFLSITVNHEVFGKIFYSKDGSETSSGELEYDEEENSIQVILFKGFNTSLYNNTIMSIILQDSNEAKSTYFCTIYFIGEIEIVEEVVEEAKVEEKEEIDDVEDLSYDEASVGDWNEYLPEEELLSMFDKFKNAVSS
jgi:hypothetical protein